VSNIAGAQELKSWSVEFLSPRTHFTLACPFNDDNDRSVMVVFITVGASGDGFDLRTEKTQNVLRY
jgi:hypothetical protein